MEISDTEEDPLPAGQASISGEDLSTVLSRKSKLRKKLIRADHHRAFLHRWHADNVTPKGLQLNRQVHPIQGCNDTASKIEDILHKAEEGMLDLLVEHYDSLVDTCTQQLQ